MRVLENYFLRKCSDVNMEYAYYEVLDGEGTFLFDMVLSDDGEKMIWCDGGKCFVRFSTMQQMLSEAERLLDAELAP